MNRSKMDQRKPTPGWPRILGDEPSFQERPRISPTLAPEYAGMNREKTPASFFLWYWPQIRGDEPFTNFCRSDSFAFAPDKRG